MSAASSNTGFYVPQLSRLTRVLSLKGLHSPHADQSPASQADHPGFLINPDLYLGPEDDVIDVDELPDSSDPPSCAPAPSQMSMSCEFLHSRRVSIPHVSPKRTKHLPTLVQSGRSSLTKIYMRWSRSSDPSGHM